MDDVFGWPPVGARGVHEDAGGGQCVGVARKVGQACLPILNRCLERDCVDCFRVHAFIRGSQQRLLADRIPTPVAEAPLRAGRFVQVPVQTRRPLRER